MELPQDQILRFGILLPSKKEKAYTYIMEIPFLLNRYQNFEFRLENLIYKVNIFKIIKLINYKKLQKRTQSRLHYCKFNNKNEENSDKSKTSDDDNLDEEEDYGYNDIIFNIQREEIWLETFKQISAIPPKRLISAQFDIEFKDEEGVDAGGLTREFYLYSFKDLFDPKKGFFTLSSNGISLQPSYLSHIIPDHLLHFQFAGRLIAKSLLDGYSCEIDFTKSFLKQILGNDLYINDLEDIDPDMTRGLLNILNENNSDQLCLDFTYSFYEFGERKVIELIENGSQIEVNEENKKNYVKSIAYYRMVKQIEPQIKAFLKGFYEIIPFKYIKILSVTELGFKLSGFHTIDIQDLKQNINYDGYNENSEQIIWFFEILEEYNQEQRASFLFFLSGSFRLPFGGFSNNQVLIVKYLGDNQALPIAHTCFRSLELPVYESKEIMQQKFHVAFTEGSKGFYIG